MSDLERLRRQIANRFNTPASHYFTFSFTYCFISFSSSSSPELYDRTLPKRRNTSHERMRPVQRHLALLITAYYTFSHAFCICACNQKFNQLVVVHRVPPLPLDLFAIQSWCIPHSDPCHASACLLKKIVSFSLCLFLSLFVRSCIGTL